MTQNGAVYGPSAKGCHDVDTPYVRQSLANHMPGGPEFHGALLFLAKARKVAAGDTADGGNPFRTTQATMRRHWLLVFTGESFQGFLGGAGFRPSTIVLV